jgi:Arc/MetJ-type ribon-helix-helix transcriptional regulator
MMQNQKKKTTIRLTREDEELLEKLGQALAYKLGKAGQASQSDVIRYSIRRIAELELNPAESKSK